MNETGLTARVAESVSSFDAAAWDALDPAGNPFTSHAFLSALEDSGSVGPGTGWQAAPLVIEDGGELLAALPTYLKGHSQGEYVFDHAWADAFERAGGDYYPKLQICAPFTPATGPRILTRQSELAAPLLSAAEELCRQNDFSSAHATFIEPDQADWFADNGWLLRRDIQFHWTNEGYDDFAGFLDALASRKRKALRKERSAAREHVRIARLRGDEIKPEHRDAFWIFYQDTGARKWGTPYLTREAFDLFAERMGEKLLMVLAFDGDEPIAGALNFIGREALYGRYWGCTRDVRFLHFELCYYQAIDAAIELRLKRVEAGAQGGHKLARGYEPVQTISAHWIADPGFRRAIADYLEREHDGVAGDQLILSQRTPFRKG
ncbi:GNAT family N-acetyltransferase [Qipengyuania atrilutea]|uniref:N-acetyltransferase n=1 Tax=Qipengyuania atrilutea TaxID=2744473 RepID=A0A850GYG5_9SPHN|nr:GNAT family N-acetyltransferase [Actirhodobacter atriluteus]NVD44674.1 N-acetyltransferase [Actirhodobacter atriluteus]